MANRKPGLTDGADTPVDAGPTRTPDNTPLPGGGSWRWDDATSFWVSTDVPPTDATPQE